MKDSFFYLYRIHTSNETLKIRIVNLKRAPEGDEGSIWPNKAFPNGVLNILRHALRVLSVQLLKANNASHFLLSVSRGAAMMDLIN